MSLYSISFASPSPATPNSVPPFPPLSPVQSPHVTLLPACLSTPWTISSYPQHLLHSGEIDIRAAAVLALVVTTSFAIVYARTFSYLLKAVIAAVYSSSRLVVHAGEDRSMEPFRGRAMSSLYKSASLLPPATRPDSFALQAPLPSRHQHGLAPPAGTPDASSSKRHGKGQSDAWGDELT